MAKGLTFRPPQEAQEQAEVVADSAGEPKLKAPLEPPYKSAPGSDWGVEEEPPVADPKALPPAPTGGWNTNMDEAPRDGALVELRSHGNAWVLGQWRTTRRRDPQQMKWEIVAWWADAISRQQLVFQPTGWRRPALGTIAPGMLRGPA